MKDCDNNISIAKGNEKLSLRKSRRGLPRYKKNPFLQTTSNNTKSGSRRITTGRDRLLVINEDTGEQILKFKTKDKVSWVRPTAR